MLRVVSRPWRPRMKTASRILGTAAFRSGLRQDSPVYGAERRGADRRLHPDRPTLILNAARSLCRTSSS